MNTPIRLVGGFASYAGRVEVYYRGQWGTVCDDSFDINDLRVMCRMLGMYRGPSYGVIYDQARNFGQGSGSIIIDDLQCSGHESDVSDCRSQTWLHHNCGHGEDVGIDCYAPRNDGTTDYFRWYDQTTASYDSVRLVGGSGYSGRVEIYHNGEWMTVCANTLDHSDIMSICRSLGYYNGNNYGTRYDSGTFGQGHSYNIVHDLSCNGYESSMSQCRIGYSSRNSRCYHSQDAGINCYGYRNDMTTVDPYEQTSTGYNAVRLVGGTRYSGRVEIYHNGEWMTVCANTLDHSDIMSICRSVGYYYGYNYGTSYGSGTYGQGHSNQIVHYLSCNGYVTSMSQCGIRSSSQNSYCYHSQDAGINCYGYRYDMSTIDPYEQSTATENAVRLVGGNRYSGRVEIYHNGEWMTVCANTLDHSDIMSICRSVGYYNGYNYGVERGSWYFGQGTSYSIIHYMNCNGYGYVSQCGIQSSYRNNYCSHSQDAGIDCSAYYYEESTTVYPYWYKQTTEGSVLENAITVSCNDYGWDININMYRLQQQFPAARADAIYLGENTCMGNDNGYNVHFNQGLHQCLTSQMVRNNILVYRNQLIYAERDPDHPFIIRNYNWTVDVECDVMRNETSSGHLHHNSGASSGNHQVSGTSHYAVNMSFFSDPNFRYQIHGYPLTVNVGDNVYVKVFSQTADWTIKMKVHTCYTQPGNSGTSYQKYDIIKNGCEVDGNTHIISQSTHETRFVFKDFEYTTNHEGINIYCDATFCPSSDYSSACSQTCNPVIRRRNLPDIDESTDSVKDFQGMKDTTEESKGTGDDMPSYETTEMP